MKDINAMRVKKLFDLVKQEESIVAFCKKHSKDDDEKPINATYISQILNGHRKFGEKSARNLESKIGLTPNYFDTEEDDDDFFTMLGVERSDIDLDLMEIFRLAAKTKKENRADLKRRIKEYLNNREKRIGEG